jgi:hypothetical protein
MRWRSFACFWPLLALVGPSPAYSEQAVSCSSGKLISEWALQASLTRQSIEIVRLAQHGDVKRLRSAVPASAKFNMGEHDVIWEVGEGPDGAISFAQRLQVSDYEFMAMDGGPPPPVSVCGEHEVTLWLLQPGGKAAYQATFKYKDGNLTDAWAHDIDLTKGKIDPK